MKTSVKNISGTPYLIYNVLISTCWVKSTEQQVMSLYFGSQMPLLTITGVMKLVLFGC